MRNFTSITPFLLLFSAYGFYSISEIVYKNLSEQKKKHFYLFLIFTGCLIFTLPQIILSIKMNSYGITPWNEACIENWLMKYPPSNSKITRLTAVPMVRINDLTYIHEYTNGLERRTPFSISELQESSYSDYLIINYFFNQYYFMWWVGGNKHAHMPIDILDNTYEGLVFKELSRYSILDCVKPWPALDNSFSVIKIPKYEQPKNLLLIKEYSFNDRKNTHNDVCKNGACEKIKTTEDEISYLPHVFFQIDIKPNTKYHVEGLIKSQQLILPEVRDGFLRVDFYNNTSNTTSRGITASVSPRYFGKNWEKRKMSIVSPKNAKTMRVSFQNHDFNNIFYVDEIKVFQSMDKPTQQELENANKKEIDNLILYPTSIL